MIRVIIIDNIRHNETLECLGIMIFTTKFFQIKWTKTLPGLDARSDKGPNGRCCTVDFPRQLEFFFRAYICITTNTRTDLRFSTFADDSLPAPFPPR